MIHSLLAATAIVTTMAGVPGVAGSADGAAIIATFNKPTHLTIDRANGDVYVVDRLNTVVRKVSGGVVSTYKSYPDGQPKIFQFGGPMNGGIVIEPPGQYAHGPFYGRGIFISSSGQHVVEQRDIYGATFVHDLPYVGLLDVPGAFDGDLTITTPKAVFNMPTGIALDRHRYPNRCCADRDLYVADTGNGSIRKLTRHLNVEGEYQARYVSTFAAGFVAPRGIAIGPDGSVYVSDTGANTVIRISADGASRSIVAYYGLSAPTGIDVDDRGNVFIADTGNHVIRRLTPDGVLETVAGEPGESGWADGEGSAARFNGPFGVQIAADGSLIVADTSNHVIRKITFVEPPPAPRRRGVKH